jgi:hypothetical protein
MIVKVSDAHALVQKLVSVVKLASVLERCPTEEQRSCILHFFLAKGLNSEDIHKEMFPVCGGSVCLVKRLKTGWKNFR